MTIHKLSVGDSVTFNGYIPEQVRWGNNDTPDMLCIGNTYTIEEVEPHSSFTRVRLCGILGRFNSVHFSLT